MNNQNQKEQVKQQVKQRYDWLSYDEIETCFNLALHDFVRLSYPSQSNRPKIENIKLDFLANNWLYARMVDILERGGGTSVTSYKENGISWTYAASYIEPMLVAQIMPKGGVPR